MKDYTLSAKLGQNFFKFFWFELLRYYLKKVFCPSFLLLNPPTVFLGDGLAGAHPNARQRQKTP